MAIQHSMFQFNSDFEISFVNSGRLDIITSEIIKDYLAPEVLLKDESLLNLLTSKLEKSGESNAKELENLPTAKQADVYTVGIILFNIITGRDPNLQGDNSNIFNSRIENDWRENTFLSEVCMCFR